MRSLRNIAISSRLWLILLASVLMLLTLTGLLLKQHYDDLYAAKEQQTRQRGRYLGTRKFGRPHHFQRGAPLLFSLLKQQRRAHHLET
ncbi:hypothetical protein [Pseudomonas aeruginosa]|uniref:hypothetical protein n=1 Tax=Pseudomonas aeruginosa TaxID=287 RepID=UPI001AEC633C|nr:hypothetical protein [Pseudomonas aeruginosa]MBP2697539.1 hypothetical protein [Pseudomonas aeruginosa]